jgi:hypothetical protein
MRYGCFVSERVRNFVHERGPRQRDQFDHSSHKVAKQRGLGPLERDIGAAAHRDADKRRERRRVVDAVADNRNGYIPSQRLYFRELGIEQQLRNRLQVECRADRFGRATIFAQPDRADIHPVATSQPMCVDEGLRRSEWPAFDAFESSYRHRPEFRSGDLDDRAQPCAA